MKRKNAKEFWEKMEKDASFRSELLKAKSQREKEEILRRHNFQFTKQQYDEAFQERYGRILNQEELKKVTAAGYIDAVQFHASIGHLWIE